MRCKELGPKEGKWYVVRIKLTETERAILLQLARAKGGRGSRSRLPSIASALSAMVRIALNCIAEHAPSEAKIPKVGKHQIKSLGLRVRKADKLNRPNLYEIMPDGTKVYDEYD